MGAVYRATRSSDGRSRVVRRGGARELRIDGSFASYWEPGRALTGSVWDALGASLLALPPGRCRRVLLLGLGGGSAARVARVAVPDASIVGVEIDAEVVALARRHLGLGELGVDVVVEDARRYLARSRARFDAVIDDVFVGRGDAVRKPDWMLGSGLAAAAARLRPGGILVSNTLDETAEVSARLAALLPGQLEIGVRYYDNRVLVGGSRLGGRALRRAVAGRPALRPALDWLHFRRRRVSPRRGRRARSG